MTEKEIVEKYKDKIYIPVEVILPGNGGIAVKVNYNTYNLRTVKSIARELKVPYYQDIHRDTYDGKISGDEYTDNNLMFNGDCIEMSTSHNGEREVESLIKYFKWYKKNYYNE